MPQVYSEFYYSIIRSKAVYFSEYTVRVAKQNSLNWILCKLKEFISELIKTQIIHLFVWLRFVTRTLDEVISAEEMCQVSTRCLTILLTDSTDLANQVQELKYPDYLTNILKVQIYWKFLTMNSMRVSNC